jgi:DNA-binding NtrC family response regulator
VRELKNAIERAVILAKTDQIELADLQPRHLQHDDAEVHVQVGTSLEEAERLLVLRTFAFTHGDHKRAATMLGLTLKDLKAKLQQYAK